LTDYYPLMARVTAALDKNTGEARRGLYERARTALVAQLRALDPPLSESEITRERFGLEEAIRRVEAESARGVTPGTGVIDGVRYTTVDFNGSVDAELPEGTSRFISVDLLKKHLREIAIRSEEEAIRRKAEQEAFVKKLDEEHRRAEEETARIAEEVRRRADEAHRWAEEQAARKRKEQRELKAALEQRPASHAFFYREGRFAAKVQTSTPIDSDIARDIHSVAASKLADAIARLGRSNAPRRLISSIDAMLASLGKSLDDVKPGILLMRFRSIEADISAYDTEEGRKEVFSDVLATLRDASSSVEDLIACYPQLAEIDAARLALRLQEKDVPEAQTNMAKIRRAAADSDLVDDSVIDALQAGEREVENTTEIIENATDDLAVANAINKRAAVVAQRLLDYRNFAARVVHKAAIDLGEMTVESWDKTMEAIPKGVAKGVEEGTAGLVKGGLALLVAKLAGPLGALAVLVASFNPLARKAKEYKDQPSESNETDKDDTVSV
jgi:hypothetical protein